MDSESKCAPLVSIIVPVYNSERFLKQCLASLAAQTYDNIEVIVVDDGSTDGSRTIIADFASVDERFRVITQQNAGPARARNAGLTAAKGEFVYFFDSDDWCEPALVERTVARLQQTDADLVALPYYVYDQRIGAAVYADWALLPDKFPGEVCCWMDNPDWLFRAFQNLPWNKFLRMSLVRDNDLRFDEEVFLTEDLMFSAPALVYAQKMTFLDDVLIYHREGTGLNVMSRKDFHALDFIDAFVHLKSFLEERGLYDRLRVAYANWAADAIVYNVSTLNSFEGFCDVLRALNSSDGLERLDLLDVDPRILHEDHFADFLQGIRDRPESFLYSLYIEKRDGFEERGNRLGVEYHINREKQTRIEALQADLKSEQADLKSEKESSQQLRLEIESLRNKVVEAEAECSKWKADFHELDNCMEQRIGRAVCRIPRALQRAVIHHRDQQS